MIIRLKSCRHFIRVLVLMDPLQQRSLVDVQIKHLYKRAFYLLWIFTLAAIGEHYWPSLPSLWYVQLLYIVVIGVILPWALAKSLLLCLEGSNNFQTWLTPIIFLLPFLLQMLQHSTMPNDPNRAVPVIEQVFNAEHALISAMAPNSTFSNRKLIAAWLYTTYGALVPITSEKHKVQYYQPIATDAAKLKASSDKQFKERRLKVELKRRNNANNSLMIWHSLSFLVVFIISIVYHHRTLPRPIVGLLSQRKKQYYKNACRLGFIAVLGLVATADLFFVFDIWGRSKWFASSPLLMVTSVLLAMGLVRTVVIYTEEQFNYRNLLMVSGFVMLFVYQIIVSVAVLHTMSEVDFAKRKEIATSSAFGNVFEQMSSGTTKADRIDAAKLIYWEFGVSFMVKGDNQNLEKLQLNDDDIQMRELFQQQRNEARKQIKSNIIHGLDVKYRFINLLLGFFIGFFIALLREQQRLHQPD